MCYARVSRSAAGPARYRLERPVNYLSLVCLSLPQSSADYVNHFRAHLIVCDAELIRLQVARSRIGAL